MNENPQRTFNRNYIFITDIRIETLKCDFRALFIDKYIMCTQFRDEGEEEKFSDDIVQLL